MAKIPGDVSRNKGKKLLKEYRREKIEATEAKHQPKPNSTPKSSKPKKP